MNLDEERLSNAPQQSEDLLLLLYTLKEKLEVLGFQVVSYSQQLSLAINNELLIVTEIIHNPNYHQRLLHLYIRTIYQDYFLDGIEEHVVGIGETMPEKINSVLYNYSNTTLLPIINSIGNEHESDINFISNDQKYSVEIGDIGVQGKWENKPEKDIFFNLLFGEIIGVIQPTKFNWLKIYIAKQADGSISGECLLNNQPWHEGFQKIYQFVETWENTNSFLGLKQFIMFRKPD
jgi:hypothetical protein